MSIGEYEKLKKEYDEHNYLMSFGEFCYEKGKADERANTVKFIVDEFNRRTVCLGRATAKKYVIDTLNEIFNELMEKKCIN